MMLSSFRRSSREYIRRYCLEGKARSGEGGVVEVVEVAAVAAVAAEVLP